MSELNSYRFEIYTKCPKTKQEGFKIKTVEVLASSEYEAKRILEKYPNFDKIITTEELPNE